MPVRIIAGTHRSRKLQVPRGSTVRPTADRAREGLFALLAVDWRGKRVLDLFAGCGSLGLEAMSRGAEHATFVENDPSVIRILKANIESLGCSCCRVVSSPVHRTLVRLSAEGDPFDVVFLDPPYRSDQLTDTLDRLVGSPLLTDTTVVVAESDRKNEPGNTKMPTGLVLTERRSYSDTVFLIYSRTPVGGVATKERT